MTKKYFRARECEDEVKSSLSDTFEKGLQCGWECGDEYISYKKGCTTYLYAHPGAGKTVFTVELFVHLAKNLNQKICVYSPETGGKKEMIWNIIQVYTGKRLYGKGAYKISPQEIEEGLQFVHDNFIIIEHNPFASGKLERFTVKDIFNQVHLAQQEYKMKIDFLCIDPFNLLDRELDDDRKAIQDYVLSTLSFINSASKKMDLHTMLVAHLAGDELVIDKDTGIEYMPKPHQSKLAGGQSFWRAGFQMIGLWREPFGVTARNGVPYEDNCSQIIVQKSKPLGIGKVGMFKIYYDTDNHTLYEKYGDVKFRCGELAKRGISFNNPSSAISQNKHWYEPSKESSESDLF